MTTKKLVGNLRAILFFTGVTIGILLLIYALLSGYASATELEILMTGLWFWVPIPAAVFTVGGLIAWADSRPSDPESPWHEKLIILAAAVSLLLPLLTASNLYQAYGYRPLHEFRFMVLIVGAAICTLSGAYQYIDSFKGVPKRA